MDDQKTEKRLILQVFEASEKCSKRIYSALKLYVAKKQISTEQLLVNGKTKLSFVVLRCKKLYGNIVHPKYTLAALGAPNRRTLNNIYCVSRCCSFGNLRLAQ